VAQQNHEVELELLPVVVEADLSLINRVLANRLDNEAAHFPPGCRPQVSLCGKNGEWELTVEDNGPGSSRALRKQAFECFVRLRVAPGAFVSSLRQGRCPSPWWTREGSRP
jgi:signal transduction histidine kinase